VIDKYAVFGNPIGHSKSPMIHGLFARQCKQAMSYEAIEPQLDGFSASMRSFFSIEGKGANVTAPFKLQAYEGADELSQRARLAGSVNTLVKQSNGSIFGDNTDGVGLVGDLQRQFGLLSGLSVMLLGAGGAARGVIGPLFDAGVASICIANRTALRAQELATNFSAMGQISATGFANLTAQSVDLIINCSSSSMTDDIPDVDVKKLQDVKIAYDMYYREAPTSFMTWLAQTHPQAKLSDGLGMLVGQAAESFFIWRGIRPDITKVIAVLRQAL
jgi:shikimate dehydrogenase